MKSCRVPCFLAALLSLVVFGMVAGCDQFVTYRMWDGLRDGGQSAAEPLALEPDTATLSSGETCPFTVSGGKPPYRFAIVSGKGSLEAAGNQATYTAPEGPAEAVVQVTDELGGQDQATVTVNAGGLQISPPQADLSAGGTLTLQITGGVPPFRFEFTGGGNWVVEGRRAEYKAPDSQTDAGIRVTDALESAASAAVHVYAPLRLQPATASVRAGAQRTFTASGGKAPYTFQVVSGGGSVEAGSDSRATYTAPATPGEEVVQVSDSIGSRPAQATVTVTAALVLSPPRVTGLEAGGSVTLQAAGGTPPYRFRLASGRGTVEAVDAVTVRYTAPASTTGTTATVRVTDSRNQRADAVIEVNASPPALQIAPTAVTLEPGATFSFQASGGTPPYAFSVALGGGTIDSQSGLYTAPAEPGSATVRVSDAALAYADAAVTIAAPAP